MGQAKLKGTTQEARFAALLAEHSAKVMTRERYEAFIGWTRSPTIPVVGQEIEFFSTINENVIGVVILDRTDQDYGYVTLGRDIKGRYRCIGVDASMTRAEARRAMLRNLKKHADSGAHVFPQGDEHDDKAGVDLFTPVVPEEKLNPNFKLLQTNNCWLPARSIMSEMMRHFHDVDGNFVEQFQTKGFDSRMWELYLYAALLEQGLFVEKPSPAPDFMVTIGGKRIFIEAVTVNPSANDPIPDPSKGPAPRPLKEMRELSDTKIPIKFGSPLWSKLSRKKPYWEMENVAGHPLIFAIADFHEPQSMTWTSTALIRYLYGINYDVFTDEQGQLITSATKIDTHEFEGKKIPSGFFLQRNSENISAVLFSASGTLAKFNRMGRLAGFGLPEHQMLRMGVKHKHDHNAVMPEPFLFEVMQGKITETWAEGLSMFHNPNAKYKVDRYMFPGTAHHYFKDNKILSYILDFHPLSSFTWNILPSGTNEAS